MLSSWGDSLRDLAGEQSDDLLGHAVSGGVGIGRGLLGLTEGALRATNVVANTSVMAHATVASALGFDTSSADGPAKELMGTEEATRNTIDFVRNDGVFKTYDKAVERTTDAFSGDNRAWSDVGSTLSQLVMPTRAAGTSVSEIGATARRFVSRALPETFDPASITGWQYSGESAGYPSTTTYSPKVGAAAPEVVAETADSNSSPPAPYRQSFLEVDCKSMRMQADTF